MKDNNLNFYQVMNRIHVGMCNSFKYGRNTPWRVILVQGSYKVRRRGSSITLEQYVHANTLIAGNPMYTVTL